MKHSLSSRSLPPFPTRLILALSAILLTGLALTSTGTLSAEDEEVKKYREFKSAKGKAIKARIIKVEKGRTVVLERSDGQKFPLAISKLSEKDQQYVYQWVEAKKEGDEDPESDGSEDAASSEPDKNMTESPVFEFERLGKVKEKRTEHFHIMQISRTGAPATRYAEKTWEQCNLVMPDLQASFEKKGFKDSTRTSNGIDFKHAGEKFLFKTFMVDDEYVWENMTEQHGDRLGSDANKESFLKLQEIVGIFQDFDNRFLAMNNSSKFRKGGGEALFVHSLSSTLLRGQAQCSRIPLWMGAGIGWNMEHRIFKKCRVSYLDYEKFYTQTKGEIKRSEIFKVDYSWIAPTKALVKDNAVSTLPQIIGASVANLTPESSGCIFAFTNFLLSDEKKVAAYKKFVLGLRKGDVKPGPGIEEIAKAFGFDGRDAMETAFHEFLKSRHFK